MEPGLKVVDSALIDRLKDDELADTIAQIAGLKMGEDYSKDRELLESLGAGYVVVGSTWWFEAEWACSGFDTYFGNTEGRKTQMAIDSYRKLGFESAADVIQEALELWKAERFKKEHEDFLTKYMELDRRLDATGVTARSKGAQAGYIRKNPDQFYINIEQM